MIRRWGLMMAALLVLPFGGAAQESGDEPDPFTDVFFAPEFIMQNRRAIDLTDEQRDAITGVIQEFQGRAVSSQFELLDEVQTLVEILSDADIDLDRAMDQVDQFLDTENNVKRAQFELLIRIKNILTPEQQRILIEIREGRRP
ncbi:MAG: hypothetical protein HKO53_16105 [Gemmatimonadetes bacterium]|nr:hypothetical protein [Gemmatimonadota bacterium]